MRCSEVPHPVNPGERAVRDQPCDKPPARRIRLAHHSHLAGSRSRPCSPAANSPNSPQASAPPSPSAAPIPARDAGSSAASYTPGRGLRRPAARQRDPLDAPRTHHRRQDQRLSTDARSGRRCKFEKIVSRAEATVTTATDYTARFLVANLQPATEYWYRFTDEEGNGSRVGRTLTAPAETDERSVRFTFVSCQDITQGANNAWRANDLRRRKAFARNPARLRHAPRRLRLRSDRLLRRLQGRPALQPQAQ